MPGKIAARPSLPSKRWIIHCSAFFKESLRKGWMSRLAKCSANLWSLSSQMKKLRQVKRCGSGASIKSRSWKPEGKSSFSVAWLGSGRVGLKWLMMERGTSMERLQELISLKLT